MSGAHEFHAARDLLVGIERFPSAAFLGRAFRAVAPLIFLLRPYHLGRGESLAGTVIGSSQASEFSASAMRFRFNSDSANFFLPFIHPTQ